MKKKILAPIITLILLLTLIIPAAPVSAAIPGGTLDPLTIPKYVTPLLIPPEMPATSPNYYEIAVRQFQQQILPVGFPTTTVWSYGSVNHPGTFNYPAFTIEAQNNVPLTVKWINDLVDASGNYLPHLLPIDQTLHWANPPGGIAGRDTMGMDPTTYTGPVPIVTHVHGAHVTEESDGYPEAWYLPAAINIPAGYATVGTAYDTYAAKAALDGRIWGPGFSIFKYPNDQRAATLWYHDHALGMTRTNVYAGPAGFYLIRGGTEDLNLGFNRPGLTLGVGVDPTQPITEIPIAIQDRSFNADGSLFYPDNRAFFEGVAPADLQIPFIPGTSLGGQPSDVSPIWNPEFFGNTIVSNGNTWPFLNVEQRQYRFRLLNGCQSRFLYLLLDNGAPFYQIGTEGGFLPSVLPITQILLGPAERADVIIDFSAIPAGTNIILQNIGPDEPFGGGVPGVDFPVSDPLTTGQVMQFRVTGAPATPDTSTPVASIVLPAITPVGTPTNTQYVSLNEMSSMTVWVTVDPVTGVISEVPAGTAGAMMFMPTMALQGTWDPITGLPTELHWSDPISEKPTAGATEMFEIHNFTADAHPIHLHMVQFQVVNREPFDPLTGQGTGAIRPPEAWEVGFKETVIAYPGEITRVKAVFDLAGLFVWHCHIVEHEDNEMMRPYISYAPPIVNAGPNATINENAAFSSSGYFNSPGLGPWTATVDYGDGSGVQPLTLNGVLFNLNHVYTTPGSYTVTVAVDDGVGGIGTDTALVTVSNLVPVVNAGPDATINEGATFSSSGSFTNGAGPWTATVNYGDGSGVQALTLTGTTFNLSHVYADNGIYTVTVAVTDPSAATGTDTVIVTVNNVAPVVNAGPDVSIIAGTTFNRSGSFTDPGADTWTATVDYGDGSGISALSLNPDKTFALSHLYPSPGVFTVSVTVTDDDGGTNTDTVQVTVGANAAPVVNAGSDATINEGSTFNSSGSFTDAGPSPWTATVNYGDGSGVTALSLNADKTFALSHLYRDNGTYTVTVTVIDDLGLSGNDTATVTVNNVAPVVSAGPDKTTQSGIPVSITAAFTDPGVLDTHTATINWGDGSSTAGTVTETNGSGTVTGTHTYLINGSYTVTVTVTDKDGSSGSDSLVITVGRLAVTIDIRPDLFDPNPINLKAKGVIPVAVLSSATFDATLIDPETILFAGASPVKGTDLKIKDINMDGIMDVIFHFNIQDTDIEIGDTSATLTGQTSEGIYFTGTDSIVVLK